jgi:uncharacterized protein YcbK (DUF882 family)
MINRRFFLALTGGFLARFTPLQALPLPTSRRIRLFNAHTHETFDGPYRDDNGPISSAFEDLSLLLRDHRSGKRITIDVGVLDYLTAVMEAVGASRATVLSAYRTVETNRMLARTSFGVADNSQHLYGRALDVRFDTGLKKAMEAARAMKRGGVGWYPRSGFIHLDTGPIRSWTLENNGLDRLLSLPQDLLARGREPKSFLRNDKPGGPGNTVDLASSRTALPLNDQQRSSLSQAIENFVAHPFDRRSVLVPHRKR